QARPIAEFHRVRRAWPIAVARSPRRIGNRSRQAREPNAVDHLDPGRGRCHADESGHRLRPAHPARRARGSNVSLGPVRGTAGRRSLEAPTWRKANPGLGDILSLEHVKRLAKQAKNVPSAEASFRNLVLNQRVATSNLFIPPSVWKACGGPVDVEALAR